MKKAALVLATLVTSLSGTVLAQNTPAPTPSERMEHRIDIRQERQEKRIDNGIASGRVNAAEAARLERQQAHIDQVENRALADGSLNRREAQRMERMQDRAGRHVRHAKHDRQRAHPRHP